MRGVSTLPSDTDATAAPPHPITARDVTAVVLGNALEFYDFTTYAFFAVMIGRAFFPAQTPLGSLLLSVATFGVGFVTRPVGGVVIGAYADRAGRKPAMLLSIALMAVGMTLLAVTPSYASIGIAAPILVVVARLIQGFALGGEVGPATAYLLEAAPPGRRAFYASWQLASQGASAVAAGLLGVGLSAALSAEQMQEWGWRVPFLLGVGIVPVGLYIRRQLRETAHAPSDPAAAREGAGAALLRIVRGYPRVVVLAMLVLMAGTISTYVGNYMTTYALTTLHLPAGVSLAATVSAGLCTLVFSLAGGWLADRYGRKPVMVAPRLLQALLAYPLFVLLVAHPAPLVLLLVAGTVTGLSALSSAAALTLIPESFPRSLRSGGLSTIYAVAITVFGGTTQFVVTWLIAATGNPLAPAWYLVVAAVAGTGAAALMRETGQSELAD